LTRKMQSEELPKPLENFARGLMATTCLTLACGTSAVAGTITLTPGAQPTSPGTPLPVGTNIVNGFVGSLPSEAGTSTTDWFEFQGLAATDNYTVTAVYNPFGARGESGNGETGLRVSLFNNSAVPYFSNQSMEGSGATLQLVPGDGFLEVEIVGGTTFGPSPAGSFYQVTLTDNGPSTATPEPGTLATVGLALAGALAWSRKRRQ
jgi:hypothetical protein